MKQRLAGFFLFFLYSINTSSAQDQPKTNKDLDPVAQFKFEGNGNPVSRRHLKSTFSGNVSFVKGLDGKALSLKALDSPGMLSIDSEELPFGTKKNFSVQLWVKTTMDANRQAVILSQKEFKDNSLASQKNPGWVLYTSGGTWAWNAGSGRRRITHERDNGNYQPLNDGKWHQLTMTYDSERSEVRLFYDGDNKALYNVGDSVGFNFTNNNPLIAGWEEANTNSMPQIEKGAALLQELVNNFTRLGVGTIEPDQLIDLVVDPKALFNLKVQEAKLKKGADSLKFLESIQSASFDQITKIRSALSANPYTVYQIKEFTEIAPLLKIYSLVDGKIRINQNGANAFIKSEKLNQPDFDIDNLMIWDRVLSSQEVLNSYAKYFKPQVPVVLKQNITSLTAADWNIWHGGKHFTVAKNGWDSRVRIAEILRKENADVIMMQETYSSGDFIAAELGYYFATTIDWDYLNQGANVSVLSRYPIKELYVPKGAPFMNVAVKLAISKTQDVYVMSNWYGMNQFPVVFDFHQSRFRQSDSIPVLFAGDFNAVPNTDGGKNLASVKMIEAGFTDAYRNRYPDVTRYPGYSHNSGERIDQLYYKGKGLKNTSVKMVETWPSGFPSDHFLILSKFELNYRTKGSGPQ